MEEESRALSQHHRPTTDVGLHLMAYRKPISGEAREEFKKSEPVGCNAMMLALD
jgi:hypothetical protein